MYNPLIMTTAFILIPGARFPAAVASELLGSATPIEREAYEAIGDGRELPVVQRIAGPLYARMPHWSWLWKVLARAPGEPQEAPALWREEGGPRLHAALWRLSGVTLSENGRVSPEPGEFSEDEMLALLSAASPIAAQAGMRVQAAGSAFYFSRAENWDAAAMPRRALTGLSYQQALEDGIAGADAPAVRSVVSALNAAAAAEGSPIARLAAARRGAGRPSIDAFWLSGGGMDESHYPPSLIRSVAADDLAVRGWAAASGIPVSRVVPVSGRKAWPEAPEGDVIVVLDGLLEPWLRHDVDAWRKRLPAVADSYLCWRGAALARGADEVLPVLFGLGTSASLPARPKRALDAIPLFRRSARPLPAEVWLVDSAPEDEAGRSAEEASE